MTLTDKEGEKAKCRLLGRFKKPPSNDTIYNISWNMQDRCLSHFLAFTRPRLKTGQGFHDRIVEDL